MRNNNVGVKFGKQSIRDIGGGFGGYMSNSKNVLKISTVDASDAKMYGKRKSLALASIDNYKPRDNLLYTQTDQLKNIELENTREIRIKQINRMKNLRKMGPYASSIFSSSQNL